MFFFGGVDPYSAPYPLFPASESGFGYDTPGIFTGSNSQQDKVIAVGDALFGSTVTALSITARGIYDLDLKYGEFIYFWAKLANGLEDTFKAISDSNALAGSLYSQALRASQDKPRLGSWPGDAAFKTETTDYYVQHVITFVDHHPSIPTETPTDPSTGNPDDSDDSNKTAVPEPATLLGLLTIGAFLIGSKHR